MPHLVTGVFYDRSSAERAVESLKSLGIAAEDIYLETEVESAGDIGRKGGEINRLETERRFAGLETGIIIGVTCGVLAGAGLGMLGEPMAAILATTSREPLPGPMSNPLLGALTGALFGLVAGGLIGWLVDFTLNRLGAGPPAPHQETLVTARVPEGRVDEAYSTLFRSRARHLHVAQRAAG
jgi:hypothetical protein